jgi:hypothetical protein
MITKILALNSSPSIYSGKLVDGKKTKKNPNGSGDQKSSKGNRCGIRNRSSK